MNQHRGVVGAEHRHDELAACRCQRVAHAIVEDIGDGLAAGQRLHGLRIVGKGVRIGAIPGEAQRAVTANKCTWRRNDERVAIIHIAVVKQNVAGCCQRAVFLKGCRISHGDRRIVHTDDRHIDGGRARRTGRVPDRVAEGIS